MPTDGQNTNQMDRTKNNTFSSLVGKNLRQRTLGIKDTIKKLFQRTHLKVPKVNPPVMDKMAGPLFGGSTVP